MIGLTGATGVLGKIFCNKLKCCCLDFVTYSGDICDYQGVYEWVAHNKIDKLIHLAAIVPTSFVKEKPLRAYEVNVSGTINLLKAFSATSECNKWFFYASTSHVYKHSNVALPEDGLISPVSLYGKTKHMAEEVLLDAAPAAMKVCVGRIFSFYDESQAGSFLYPTLRSRFETEDLTQPFLLRGAESVRDFLPATKVVEIILEIMAKEGEGVFNIGSGKGMTIGEFAQKNSPVPLSIVSDGVSNCLIADVRKLNDFLGK